MQNLHITGKITNILLQTLGQEAVVPAYTLAGLEISGIEGKQFYTLPDVFAQKKMPVTADNIVILEELTNWPYLSRIHISKIEANVDLLIGTDAPKILEPWEVIHSHGRGPYAIRTVLGWVVNGLLNKTRDSSRTEVSSATVNRISVCQLEKMLANQYNREFNEKTEEKEMSREDLKFLETMEGSAVLQDGKYCLKLPFRIKSVCPITMLWLNKEFRV